MGLTSRYQLFTYFYRSILLFLVIGALIVHHGTMQSLEVDYKFIGSLNVRLINGVASTPIRFVYSNFSPVDRLFCKYTNSTTPFASFSTQIGTANPSRVLTPHAPDYMVVNSSIGIGGYFGLKIVARIDRDDSQSIICQYSTKFTIGSSSIIQLSVISPVTIHPFLSPILPFVGDKVEAGCIVEGYPYPTVEIDTPKKSQYVATQINPSGTKLISYKYSITVPAIDDSWNGQRIYCTALQSGGKTIDNFVTIRLGDVNGHGGNNPAVITGAIIGGFAALALLLLAVVLVVTCYRKKISNRQRFVRNRYEARDISQNSKPPGNRTINDDSSINDDTMDGKADIKVFRRPEGFANSYEVSTAAFV